MEGSPNSPSGLGPETDRKRNPHTSPTPRPGPTRRPRSHPEIVGGNGKRRPEAPSNARGRTRTCWTPLWKSLHPAFATRRWEPQAWRHARQPQRSAGRPIVAREITICKAMAASGRDRRKFSTTPLWTMARGRRMVPGGAPGRPPGARSGSRGGQRGGRALPAGGSCALRPGSPAGTPRAPPHSGWNEGRPRRRRPPCCWWDPAPTPGCGPRTSARCPRSG
jgi:hypothetical protein